MNPTSSSATGKRKASSDDLMEIMPLGAGNEVGRSSVLMKFKGKQILFDAGVHPAHTGLASLPYFDAIDDPADVDLLLVTHFHLDHCASVPYFTEKTNFKGRIFMTHPTKAVFKLILHDFVKVSSITSEDTLYDETDLMNCLEKIEVINYHQELEVNGIKFWCYNAGHVLGAAMFMVEIDGTRILYTGDFSRQTDRHLMVAELPTTSPDVLIVESTYGKQVHEPREARELRFTESVTNVVSKRRGRCLLPVFALGRAQELLLILDEHWEANPKLQHIPIYYASSLAKKCMSIYQYYIYMMNERIRDQIAVRNPFKFKHIRHLESMSHFNDSGPSVVMASPGMLQSGMSRQLFERWCSDKRNGLVIPGYVVEGTLAKHVISEPKTIQTMSGLSAELRMSVEYISFSAHSDFHQTSEFVEALEPPHIILVHGEANEMGRLKGALLQKYRDKAVRVYNPKNCQAVQITFHSEKIAKTVGQLAASVPNEGDLVSGVLVRHHFSHRIMTPADLRAYTQLQTSAVTQRLSVPFYRPFSLAEVALRRLFDDVRKTLYSEVSQEDNEMDTDGQLRGAGGDTLDEEEDKHADTDGEAVDALVLHDDVYVVRTSEQQLNIVWHSNPISDMIADGAVAALVSLQATPDDSDALDNVQPVVDESTKLATRGESAVRLLKSIYNDVRIGSLDDLSNDASAPSDDAASHTPAVLFQHGDTKAAIALADGAVHCAPKDDALHDRLTHLWQRLSSAFD